MNEWISLNEFVDRFVRMLDRYIDAWNGLYEYTPERSI